VQGDDVSTGGGFGVTANLTAGSFTIYLTAPVSVSLPIAWFVIG
jgi:hypothetical protein